MGWQRTPYSGGLSGRRGSNTEPELLLRKALRQAGVGYHLQPVLGMRLRADVLVRRANVVVFVDGCFWHQCPEHKPAPKLGPNAALWRKKFEATRARDGRAMSAAKGAGFEAVRIFECKVRADPHSVVRDILAMGGRRPRRGGSGALDGEPAHA